MISWAAMDRICERKIASDAEFRKKITGRAPLRSDAKLLTDGELLAKLHSFGVDLDRSSLERLCDQTLSAEEIVKTLMARFPFKPNPVERESDWIWVCLAALWQRWFSDKPCFELLDDKMQTGYDLLASAGAVAACRIWLDAWSDVLRILVKTGIPSIREFDKRFRGTQSLFNWIQDLEDELWNAGLEDRQFLIARITVCEEGLRRFRADDDLMTENRRRALAESYYELGETDKAEALYREWLETDPRWGWGWIGWSDYYRFTRTKWKDLSRSEQLLRQGLSIAEVRDRPDLAERLADLYEEQGRGKEAKEFRRQAKRSVTATQPTPIVRSAGSVLRQSINFEEKGLPLGELSAIPSPVTVRQKIGRNEPCPCGSGKKFKKCCGRGLSV